ncbi:MAG: hypothetical protein K6A76_09655 [Oribacterium sp.]|nr:hypothetical protein [Oribacterium sp.]
MKNKGKMFMISAALTAAVSLSQTSLGLAAQKEDIAAALELLNDSQKAEYYNTVADFYKTNGLDIPEDIKAGLAMYSGENSESVATETVASENAPSAGTLASTAETLTPTAGTLAPAAEDTSAGQASTTETTGTAETSASSAGAAVSAGVNDTSSVYKTDENGTTLLYKADAATGEATELYNGWYTDASGDKFYYEDGKLTSGWIINDGKFYYLDPSTGTVTKSAHVDNFYVGEDGVALMDTVAPDGTKLAFNGSVYRSKEPAEKLSDLTSFYREELIKDPYLIAEFSERHEGGYQLMPEKENGFSWYTYASLKLYKRKADGSMGSKVYEGDGCLRRDALIEIKESDGSVTTMSPSQIIGSGHETWVADHIHIDPAGFVTYSAARK